MSITQEGKDYLECITETINTMSDREFELYAIGERGLLFKRLIDEKGFELCTYEEIADIRSIPILVTDTQVDSQTVLVNKIVEELNDRHFEHDINEYNNVGYRLIHINRMVAIFFNDIETKVHVLNKD